MPLKIKLDGFVIKSSFLLSFYYYEIGKMRNAWKYALISWKGSLYDSTSGRKCNLKGGAVKENIDGARVQHVRCVRRVVLSVALAKGAGI